MNELLKKFNLPSYIDGLSFSESSKKIHDKGKGRVDPEWLATEKDMLGRLKEMQEYVKAQRDALEQPQREEGDVIAGEDSGEHEMEDGSVMDDEDMNEYADGGEEEKEEEELGIGNLSKYAGAATGALDLTQDIFNPSGVDTSGRTRQEEMSTGSAVGSGVAKGAMAGASLGVPGMIGGALFGGISGLFKSNKHNRDVAKANYNNTLHRSSAFNNQFADGGNENPFGKIPTVADTLMKRSPNARIKPASQMNFDAIDSYYKDFKNAKMDSINVNNSVKPSGKYIKLNTGRNRGAEVDTALIDAVEAAEKRGGLKRGDIGATINREANFGGQSGKGMNYGKEVLKSGQNIDLMAMSNNYKGSDRYVGLDPLRHFADLKAPGVTTNKNFHGQYYQIEDKKALDDYIRKNPKSVSDYQRKLSKTPYVKGRNSLDFLADDMKAAKSTQEYRKNYNPGDPNYGNLMNKDAMDLSREKEYNRYLDTNRFAEGGEEGSPKKGSKKTAPVLNPLMPVSSLKPSGFKTLDGAELVQGDFTELGIKRGKDVTPMQKLKLAGINAKKAVGDNLDILRYAPAAMNMEQLLSFKKTKGETVPELDARYDKQLTDESTLTNLVREETNANRDAILNSSEGSSGAVRANLLGSQLLSTKALSDAYIRSTEANNAERRREKEFNTEIDWKNAGQRTMAQDIRARNEDSDRNELSKLKTAVGADLGEIGKEELYKKFPELLGMDYVGLEGKYKKKPQEEKKTTRGKK